MKQTKSCFEHMLCIRSDDHFYKLIFIYSGELPEKTEELIRGETAKKIRTEIGFTMGYLEDSWKKRGMTVSQVQIILPPRGEYLLLRDSLLQTFLEEGYLLLVEVGVFIPIPDGDLRSNIEDIDEKFTELRNKDYGNN